MATYRCEESSILCTRFQSAICLHCNRRLCLEHITDHNRILYSDIINLTNDVQLTYEQIQRESEKRTNIFNNILTSYDQWKIKEIHQIHQIYEKHLKLIESQREVLNKGEMILFEQLEQNASQLIEHVKQQQQNASTEIFNHIQKTIKKVREDNVYLKWKLNIPSPPVHVELKPLNVPSISLPRDTTTTTTTQSDTKIKKSKVSSTNDNKQLPNGHALQRLVILFSNITSIKQSKREIIAYVKASGSSVRFANFVCSYLTAWHQKSTLEEKVYLLNEHITTIQEILSERRSTLDVIFGVQAFFYNEHIRENKNEMMAFLLQFFLNHHLTNEQSLFKWYNDIKASRYEGLNQAKQFAKSFIESLQKMPLIDNTRTVSIEPSSFGQSFLIDIKQEPTSINQ